ncbi:hypothetical protein [Nitrobacter sp.]|jgi:hypothetical protein|uniref:hypothetical protein n=1 Tax=Nitrobacter sp. TaxID=29420 RepID=UPI00321FC64C
MRVKIVTFRQGDFWPDAVHPGQVLDLPGEVGQYLIEVGAAVADAPTEDAEKPAKPAKGKA